MNENNDIHMDDQDMKDTDGSSGSSSSSSESDSDSNQSNNSKSESESGDDNSESESDDGNESNASDRRPSIKQESHSDNNDHYSSVNHDADRNDSEEKNLVSNNPSDSEEEDDDDDDQKDGSPILKSSSSRKSKNDFKEILENFPDAVRRSSRSRREPERFQAAEAMDSDDGSDNRTKKRRKRKDSDEWNDEEGDHGDDDEEDDDYYGSSDDNYKSSTSRNRSKSSSKTNDVSTKSRSKLKNRRKESRANRSSRTNKSSSSYSGRNNRSYSESETEEDRSDDDCDDEIKNNRSAKHSRRTNAKVSYKEESDHTDSDDLIAVDQSNTADGGELLEEAEEEGEMIERVLEHRFGRVGATGLKTAPYNIDDNGDPNENFDANKEEKEIQFLIKWKGWSYMHCTWESKNSLEQEKARGVKKIENYLKRDEEIKQWKKYATPEDIDYYEGQEEMNYQLRQLHLNVERIIAHQAPKTGQSDTCHPEYFCKWDGLPYAECSWEDGALISKKFPIRVKEYYQRQKSQNIPTKFCKVLKTRPKFAPMKNQPDFIGGPDRLELRDYQLDGLNWLVQSWCKDHSVILADEMGLGKTIQTISFLNYLFHQHSLHGPFLLVVPLSTLAAWQREFDIWAPEMNVVVYVGDATSRNMIRSYEWCHPGNGRLKFNVLLTTYEILIRDRSLLSPIPWAVLGVDEAHRLKNDESILYKCLFSFETNHRLLITGTPLQNSLRELWALLHFIMPERFNSWPHFESEHNDSYNKGFSKLHSQIQQYLLRRVKKDVEKSLPAKVEQILRVEMTSIQKQYYKWILTKNYKALSKGVKGSLSGFTNIVMELKKCCNHASLVRPVDEEWPHLDHLQKLIRCSGKLLLLDKLLCRLKETGHRVLIFSQMVRMLDLLGEYLSLRRFSYQRLDGSIRGEIRKQALDHFNAEGSQDFCFLLSTRAGGLGINLATADTVIIFDSDWNPQNDLQAQARAHRIGQKNQVNIYRLVTKGSVEEDIIERAKRKMVLDHLVIQRMDTSGHTIMANKDASLDSGSKNSTPFNKEELSAILKFGAEDLFKETDNGDEEPQCDIDEILKRAETRCEDDTPHTLGDELLSSFKVASFNFNEEEDVSAVSTMTESKSQKDWDDIIPEAERLKLEEERQKEEMEVLMLPRNRNKSKMSGNQSDSDEYDPLAKEKYGDSGASDDSDADRPKRRGRPKSASKELIKGFSEAEVRRFIKSYKKFPTPMKRLESIAIDAELQEKPIPDLQRLANELQQGCENIMKESEKTASEEGNKKNNRGPSFKLGGVTVFAKTILSNQKDLEPLGILLPENADDRKRWSLNGKVKSANWDCMWNVDDDSRLLAGVYEYGLGNWEAIKMDPSYKLADKILPDGELKPQAKQLQSRVDYLLKLLHKQIDAKKPKDDSNSGLNSHESNKVTTKGKKSKTIDGKTTTKGDKVSPKKEKKSKQKNSVGDEDSSKTEHKKKRKDKKTKEKKLKKAKKSKKKKSNKQAKSEGGVDNDNGENLNVELDSGVFQECKERMRTVKKALKALNCIDDQVRHGKKLSKGEQKEIFHDYIKVIGAHIDSCLVQYSHDTVKMKEWRNNLWTFVSQFTEYRAKKLYKIYRHEKLSKGSAGSGLYDKSGNISAASSDHSNHSNNYYHRGGGASAGGQSHRKDTGHKSMYGPISNSPATEFTGSSHKRDLSNVSGSSLAPPSKFPKHSHNRDYSSQSGSYSKSGGNGSYNSSSNTNYHSHHSYNDNRGWSSSSSSTKHDNANYRNSYSSMDGGSRYYGSSKNSSYNRDIDDRSKRDRDRDRYYSSNNAGESRHSSRSNSTNGPFGGRGGSVGEHTFSGRSNSHPPPLPASSPYSSTAYGTGVPASTSSMSSNVSGTPAVGPFSNIINNSNTVSSPPILPTTANPVPPTPPNITPSSPFGPNSWPPQYGVGRGGGGGNTPHDINANISNNFGTRRFPDNDNRPPLINNR